MKCRCTRPIESERASKGRKTCGSCCSGAVRRGRIAYCERDEAGLCVACGEQRTGKAKTCRPCQEAKNARGSARREVLRSASRDTLRTRTASAGYAV